MHKKITIHEIIHYVTLGILVLALAYQIYNLFIIKNELQTINLDLKSQEIIANNLQEELDSTKTQFSSQFTKITQQQKESSSQLSTLKKDISNIQVDLSNVQIKSQDFTVIIEDVIQSVVSVLTDKGQGSGVFIENNGYIVTNYHVIEKASVVKVLTYDNKVTTADIVGVSKNADIALLKIDSNEYAPLKLGNSDELKVGQRIIAVGNPLGLSFSVTEGIISATKRKGPNGLEAYIQIDVPINPGNSGGPLINIKKEIVGIANFKIGGFESLGFAIESNHVKDVVDQIFEKLSENV